MQPTNKSTGLLSSSQLINNGRAVLAGAQIITDGTNDATLIIYDATSATGTELFKQVVTGSDDSIPYTLPDGGVRADTGIYASIAGTGANFIIYYR